MIANLERPEPETEVPVETNHEVVDDYVYLIGRPLLRQFLSFVKNRSPNGRLADVGPLIDEWRANIGEAAVGDRKSTRLNSSHGYISYAVFCFKKKKTHPPRP